VTVEFPFDPALMRTLVGLTETLKPCGPAGNTVIVNVTVWEKSPLVPVTVTEYVPDARLVPVTILITELLVPAVSLTVEGLRNRVGPLGETEAARLTQPVKLFKLLRLMVELAVVPAYIVMLDGLAATGKSSDDNFHPVSG